MHIQHIDDFHVHPDSFCDISYYCERRRVWNSESRLYVKIPCACFGSIYACEYYRSDENELDAIAICIAYNHRKRNSSQLISDWTYLIQPKRNPNCSHAKHTSP